jgi:surface protein
MAVRLGSSTPVGLSRERFLRSANTARRWVRPVDWVSFAIPANTEQKVIGIVAVWNQASNYVAFACATSAGTYTVDWGDGTSTTYSSNVVATKNYVWDDISSDTLSSRGYRQAVITITPTTVGATFSGINLKNRHSATNSTLHITNPWLDVAVAAPNATSIEFTHTSGGTKTSSMHLCEQVTIVAHNTTSTANMFRDLKGLQSVPLFNTAAVTNMTGMFNGCDSLQTVPLFNTAAVTNMTNMFTSCSSLQSVPLFNTASVTTMTNMFSSCYSLQTVPLFNTASVTTMTSMFYECKALQSVPLFNTASVTNMTSMFENCYSLQTVPLFNTASVTTMTSMFEGCNSLQSVPLFNTASVTGMSRMFYSCYSLQSVPLFNTASVTGIGQMFAGCFALRTVPLFNTASVIIMSAMFQSCASLQTVPLFNTAAVTNVSSMFSSCHSLQNIPELNLTRISSVGNNTMDIGNATAGSARANLGQAKLTGMRWTQSFQNCKMGAAQLNEMYTALAVLNPNVTNVTASAGVVTYTVDDIRAFVAARTVTITSVDPVAYNLVGATVGTVTAGAGTTGTFTVTNAATGAYVSGGVASITDNRTITVTSNPGVSEDDPTIATNKGWIVTG